MKLFLKFIKVTTLFVIVSFFNSTNVNAYMCKYKEDFYKLYHIHYQQYPDDCMENIYWLEQAVRADFCNPTFINVKITNQDQYEKYRYLFMMHLNLKLVEQHLRLGRTYDKKAIYFYDAPWKEEYLSNLKKTKSCYEAGYYYWKEAQLWAEKANIGKFNFLIIQELQNWEDERERIKIGELNYKKMLDRELTRVNKNIQEITDIDKKYESRDELNHKEIEDLFAQ